MTAPTPGTYNTAATTVDTTPTLIATVSDAGDGGVLVQNNGTATIYLGGETVTATGATQGFSLLTTTSVLVPSVGGPANTLWAVTASGTASVVVLFPSGA